MGTGWRFVDGPYDLKLTMVKLHTHWFFFFNFSVLLFIQNLISIRMMILYNQNDDTLGVPCTQTIPLITCHRLLPATKINQCDDYCGLHHDLDRKKLIQRISSIHGLKSLSSFFLSYFLNWFYFKLFNVQLTFIF